MCILNNLFALVSLNYPNTASYQRNKIKYIQSGAKKTQLFQHRFSHINIYQNTPSIYQIKHNWMNFMMVKTVS